MTESDLSQGPPVARGVDTNRPTHLRRSTTIQTPESDLSRGPAAAGGVDTWVDLRKPSCRAPTPYGGVPGTCRDTPREVEPVTPNPENLNQSIDSTKKPGGVPQGSRVYTVGALSPWD